MHIIKSYLLSFQIQNISKNNEQENDYEEDVTSFSTNPPCKFSSTLWIHIGFIVWRVKLKNKTEKKMWECISSIKGFFEWYFSKNVLPIWANLNNSQGQDLIIKCEFMKNYKSHIDNLFWVFENCVSKFVLKNIIAFLVKLCPLHCGVGSWGKYVSKVLHAIDMEFMSNIWRWIQCSYMFRPCLISMQWLAYHLHQHLWWASHPSIQKALIPVLPNVSSCWFPPQPERMPFPFKLVRNSWSYSGLLFFFSHYTSTPS